MSFVIAVAGPIGAGKSSLVDGLAGVLPSAATVRFDHYENITGSSPAELIQWLENGADFNKFEFPGLLKDLQRLKQGNAIVDPLTGETIAAQEIIIVEMPFGRAHTAMAAMIDLLIWIDLPLDIALARKLKQHIGRTLESNQPRDYRGDLTWLHGLLDNHLLFVHDVMMIQRDRVRPGADLVLDGTVPPQIICREAAQFLLNQHPCLPEMV